MTTLSDTSNLKSGKGDENILALKPQTNVRGDSNLRRSLRALRNHRMALVGAGILVAIILYVIVGAFFVPYSASIYNDPSRKLQAPSAEHIFGTDSIGRDIFARTIWGGQVSLFIGFTAVIVQILLGTLVGLLAGYLGGIVDTVLMRITEAMLSIPQLFFALVIVKIFSNPDRLKETFGAAWTLFADGTLIVIFVIGLTSWMRVSRIVRSVVLSVKEQEYVTAARSIGMTSSRIVFRHVLPNCVAPIIVAATLGVAGAILLEAYLGFLGIGVRAPAATWGNIINDAYRFIGEWYYWFFPAIFIILTVLGINFLGDGLRDALDPRSLK
ncbi:MAG: oligopeptide ABC transporter permease AppC [Anaerolineae bacterium]